jgi:glycosyltransferase involved in cell wall biosynthesis
VTKGSASRSRVPSPLPADDTVLFVSVWAYLGGGQASLLTLLRALPTSVGAVLAAPSEGPLVARVGEATAVREHVVLAAKAPTTSVRARLGATAILARWIVRNRRRLRAIHANGEAELKLLLPLLALVRVPIVVWHHSKTTAPSTLRLAPLWRRLRRRIVWAAVSETSRRELIKARVAVVDNAVVVPNPIDRNNVVPRSRPARKDATFAVGYLGFEDVSKGLLVLSEIALRLVDAPVRLVVVTKGWPREWNSPEVNEALDRLGALQSTVSFRLRDHDVRNIYADIDGLIVPSLAESFCRIAAEAMLNGLPVVASDLPALHELLGDEDAGLLFPVGDASAAAAAIRRLAANPELRARLSEAGSRRAATFKPERVASQLLALYRLPRPAPPERHQPAPDAPGRARPTLQA